MFFGKKFSHPCPGQYTQQTMVAVTEYSSSVLWLMSSLGELLNSLRFYSGINVTDP